jgi:hypothetical protein
MDCQKSFEEVHASLGKCQPQERWPSGSFVFAVMAMVMPMVIWDCHRHLDTNQENQHHN